MTTFSNPISIPWTRDANTGSAMTYTDAMGGAARLTADIALMCWGETVFAEGNFQDSQAYMAAVRYTETGPVIGPVMALPASVPVDWLSYQLEAVTAGADGEAWIAMTRIYYKVPANNRGMVGRITVDPTTLALTLTWRGEYVPSGQISLKTLMAAWPEQRLLIIATPQKDLLLVHMDTGAVVASAALPLRSGTSSINPVAIAFRPQEVFLIGSRVTGGYYRPTFFRAPLTPTTIGAWVNHTITFPQADDVYAEASAAVALADGRYEIAMAFDDGTWNDEGTYILRHFYFTPPSALTEEAALSTLFEGLIGDQSTVGMAYESTLARTVIAFSEDTDRTDLITGSIGGVRHVEITASAASADIILPRTNQSTQTDIVHMVPLGAGRFLYLVGGTAITKPLTDGHASYEFLAYAGGPTQVLPAPPGIKGVGPDENRRAFRRVN